VAEETPVKRTTPKRRAALSDISDAALKKQRKKITVSDLTARQKRVTKAVVVKKEPIDFASPLGHVYFARGRDGLFHSTTSPPPESSTHASQRQTNSNIPQQTHVNVAPSKVKASSSASVQQKANQSVFRASAKLEEPTMPQATTTLGKRKQADVQVEEPTQPQAPKKRRVRFGEGIQKRLSRSRTHKLGEHQCLICGLTFDTLDERDDHGMEAHPTNHSWLH
jgi:hypothetical protein